MNDDVAIPLLVIGLPVLVFGTVWMFRFFHRRREMEHRERMRSLDLGQPLPGAAPGAGLVCATMGAGVPIAACFCALIATLSIRDEDLIVVIWAFTMIIAVGGLVAGYRLALRLLASPAPSARPFTTIPSAHDKPQTDPDLYDVVGRRG
jgi:hypothetical protein